MKFLFHLPSAFAIIAANLVPLYGAVFLGWNVFSIILLYWLESAIIGFFTILKMRRAQGRRAGRVGGQLYYFGNRSSQEVQNTESAAGFYIPFFLVHFGLFMFVHLIFVVIFFGVLPTAGGQATSPDFGGILISALSLLASHTFSYFTNFLGRKEYLIVSASELFISPYPRIFVMHLTVIFGGYLVMSTTNSIGVLALMIVLKVIADVGSHLFEHGQIAKKLL